MIKKQRKIVSVQLVIVILLIGGGGMTLLASLKAKATKIEQPPETRFVRIRPMIPGPQIVTIRTDGFLESARVIDIQSSVAGKVVRTHGGLKGGTIVKKGDLLLDLDDKRARLTYEKARTEMIQAASGFITSAELAKGERSAWTAYIARLNRADVQDLPEPPLSSDRQRLLAATKGVVSARHAMESAALDLFDHKIWAPFSGILTGDGIGNGTWVSAGMSLASLVETGRLELRLSLTSDDLLNIEIGDSVSVSRPEDDLAAVGQVVRIEPLLSAGSQTARVHVALKASPEDGWLPGSFVEATIEGRIFDEAYRVPRGVLTNGNLPVYQEGRLALIPVTILARDATDILLAADLPTGTEMVETMLERPIAGMLLKKRGDE